MTHITITINRPAGEVYQFASNPENFLKWVAFIKSMARQENTWHATTDVGDIKIEWPPQNDFGIMDHTVTVATGERINNPMRVVTNGDGCEFTFTLFRIPGRTDKEFEDDAEAVKKDLEKLKEIMESRGEG